MAEEGFAQVTAINRSLVPAGTIEELQKEGLSPAEYASCAQPNKMLGIIGCDRWNRCNVSAKGKAGRRNYGIKIVGGPGGLFHTTCADCLWIADNTERIEANKGTIIVVADEGQEFDKITSVLVNNNTNKETHPRDRDAHSEERRVKVRVPAVPRPGQNPELLRDIMRAETAQMEQERISNETRLRSLGLDRAIPAIDQRASGAGEERPAEGGAKPKR